VTARERRGWLIVVSLFVAMFVLFGGGYNTAGVFFDPMRKYFGWSSARQSSLLTIFALTCGLTVPLFGWILDKVEARIVMTAGVLVAGCAMIMASRANSFTTITLAYVVLGVAIPPTTLLPTWLVVANWFEERRGLALGIATSGTSIGGMVLTIIEERTISAHGWRAGYVLLATMTFFIVTPLVAVTIRTRPPGERGSDGEVLAGQSAGMDLRAILHSRAFWLLSAAQFCYSLTSAGITVHTIPYLLRSGFSSRRAAWIYSLVMGLSAAGHFVIGYAADFVSGRITLAATLGVSALGVLLLLGTPNHLSVGAFIGLYGITAGAPLALIPMVIAESLGLNRFGSSSGLTGIAITLGGAIGPYLGGLLFDRGLGYGVVFTIFSVVLAMGSIAAFACPPLKSATASAT